jgi:hypothetical protein
MSILWIIVVFALGALFGPMLLSMLRGRAA